jgi:hypothetical protein
MFCQDSAEKALKRMPTAVVRRMRRYDAELSALLEEKRSPKLMQADAEISRLVISAREVSAANQPSDDELSVSSSTPGWYD